MEKVIVVDDQDNALGTVDKMEAHVKGMLHRAFSVIIFNSKGEMLLQKRANQKYHSAGLWTNTCCSHPMPGETIEEAAHRRLREEMGIDADLNFSHKFIYKTHLDNNLIEYELDHVYTGTTDLLPAINRSEVQDWKYADLLSVKKEIKTNPDHYSYWFKLIINDPAFRK